MAVLDRRPSPTLLSAAVIRFSSSLSLIELSGFSPVSEEDVQTPFSLDPYWGWGEKGMDGVGWGYDSP